MYIIKWVKTWNWRYCVLICVVLAAALKLLDKADFLADVSFITVIAFVMLTIVVVTLSAVFIELLVEIIIGADKK